MNYALSVVNLATGICGGPCKFCIECCVGAAHKLSNVRRKAEKYQGKRGKSGKGYAVLAGGARGGGRTTPAPWLGKRRVRQVVNAGKQAAAACLASKPRQ